MFLNHLFGFFSDPPRGPAIGKKVRGMAKKTSAWPGWGPKFVEGLKDCFGSTGNHLDFGLLPRFGFWNVFLFNPRAGWWLALRKP